MLLTRWKVLFVVLCLISCMGIGTSCIGLALAQQVPPQASLPATQVGTDQKPNASKIMQTEPKQEHSTHLYYRIIAMAFLQHGELLLTEGKTEEAARKWEIANALFPESSIIANNYAWVLTYVPTDPAKLNAQLLKADRLISHVLALTLPDDRNLPYYHGTRGTIYLKLGRYEEARRELELCSQRPNADNDVMLQKQLVEVYERLADKHRAVIAEIKKRHSYRDPVDRQKP